MFIFWQNFQIIAENKLNMRSPVYALPFEALPIQTIGGFGIVYVQVKIVDRQDPVNAPDILPWRDLA